jgi:4-nitrophenyl phosphatase
MDGRTPATSHRQPSVSIGRVLLLVDLDGVVYRGRSPIHGVAAVLAERAAAGDDVVYVTNNSVRYRTDYLERLASLGAPVDPARIVTSARATALYLAEQEPPLSRALVLGGPGLCRELRDVGLAVADAGEIGDAVAAGRAAARRGEGGAPDALDLAGQPEVVVVGLDPDLTYRGLAVATDAIRAGARFIATNRDPVFPTESGLRPGAGSIVAAVETATGIHPVAIGKPAPLLLREAARTVGADAASAIMIGDSLVTDIPAARAVGCRSVLMLTGVTSRAQLDALPPADRPTEVAADASGLASVLERLASAAVGR